MNKILKDVVVKSKLMAGFRSPYVPGWDCHGLPIEVAVEKKVGKVGQKVDAAEFRRLCREYATKQIDLHVPRGSRGLRFRLSCCMTSSSEISGTANGKESD